jgi:PAS domain S-box-containing protein
MKSDITRPRRAEQQRHKAEEVLRESEARFRSLFENMLEGIAYCRMLFEQDRPQDFLYLHVNDAFERLTGLKNVVGRKVTEVIPGIRNTNPELFEIYGRVAATGQPEKFETYVETLGIWFSISVYSPARGQFVAVFDNITERKRAAEAQRISAAYARSLLEASPDPLVTISAEGKITDVNEASVLASGVPREQLIGTDFSDYFTEPERAGEGYRRVFSEGFVRDYPLAIRHVSGRVTDVLYNASVYRDAQGRVLGVFAAARDITERKRAAEELRQLNLELEERVRLRTAQLEAANQELEAFSYSVSHDLRAPVRAMDGFAGTLVEDHAGRLDEEGLRILGVIRSEAARMGQLIDDLLAFSRVGRRPMQSAEIDLTSLARTVFAECAAGAAGRKIRLKLDPLPPARGDPSLIRQVLANLLSNAIKYTGPRAEAEIELGSRVEGNENIYWVKDNGVGFDPKYAGKLFGIFQRLHSEEEFEGTGVGLALVQRIVLRHGGRVWAEGKLNEGAVFYFTL